MTASRRRRAAGRETEDAAVRLVASGGSSSTGSSPRGSRTVRAREASDAGELDAVWRALSNPIRRRMLDLMREGPLTTGELAGHFPDHSRFAVMQHLRVLEEGDLVIVRREGRVRYNHLNAVPIQRIYDRWVRRYARHWAEALVDLKAELELDNGASDD